MSAVDEHRELNALRSAETQQPLESRTCRPSRIEYVIDEHNVLFPDIKGNVRVGEHRLVIFLLKVVAIKEANGNISKIVETMSYVHGKLDLYSGNDDQIIPLLALGGKGVISVLSNLLPRETCEMCKKFFEGDIAGAAEMQYRYHALIDSLFSEVNPIPVKAAMSHMGFCENRLRLPLTPMDKQKEEKLVRDMREAGINV